jgi:inosose dehydratase
MDLEKLGHTGITWPFTPDGARQAMADIAGLGYRGIELFGFVLDAYPGGVDGVRADLDRYELQLAGAYCSVSLVDPAARQDDVQRMGHWADQVKTLGGNVVVVGPNPRKRSSYGVEDYGAIRLTLAEIGRVCADKGVTACFHPHTGTPVETREEIAMVMDEIDVDVVAMAPDTGQIAKGGADPVEVVRTYASLVRHIHLKDYVGGTAQTDSDGQLEDRTGYLDYLPLGRGVVDLPAIAKTLVDSGFDGWWMAELDGTPAAPVPPKDAAATSWNYLTASAANSGQL